MSEADGGWLLEIVFTHPYDGVEKTLRDGGLVLAIPFGTEQSAWNAFAEMQTDVRPRFRVVPGEVLRGETE